MKKSAIIELLPEYEAEQVETFASYCIRLLLEKDRKTKEIKNPWIQKKTDEQMATYFKKVSAEGLVIDDKHITLQSRGVSYDYIAYKNKMFLVYPESIFDIMLVHEGDTFNCNKKSGEVDYFHDISDPFNQTEENLKGGYCIIKNKRGEFLTLLSPADIAKARKKASTDSIWKEWFKDMATKTVIKKACSKHFGDIYQNIETMDNENSNLENPVGLDLKFKQEIDEMKTIEELKAYYLKNKGKGKDFDKYVMIRKQQLLSNNNTNNENPPNGAAKS